MENKDYDFSGWATRNDLKCSDGRIIRRDAFKHNDGMTVPLVWNHDHTDPYRVIGHALLENRDEGVYAYGKFNETDLGKTAKIYVEHGDITAMSIYANQLQQQGPNVMHGNIRELSLVLAGANPGAYIENVIKHGDETDDEARIYTGFGIELAHSEESVEDLVHAENQDNEKKGETEMPNENEETIADVFNTLSEKQKNAVYAMIGTMVEDDEEDGDMEHADMSDGSTDETIGDILNTLSEKQMNAVYALIGQALEDAGVNTDNNNNESTGGKEMKHNVFDNDERHEENTLSHSEMEAIVADAKRCGSLKEAVLQHGIEQIDVMFPDAQSVNPEPEFIKRDDTWVANVLGSVHHSPFARIKSVFADITADEARAKGYIKGTKKVDEVFSMLKRVTTPTTIYKKQKLDRDDILDIKDFNIVPWLKSELRMMLNEELARAILVGDGRTTLSEDKIKEDNIRPIWTDNDLYTVKAEVSVADSATADDKARAFIKACVKSRKEYKGTGNPVMYMSEDILTDCLLIEDKNGRVIYDSVDKLKSALRVSDIISVPVMEGLTREVESKTHTLAGIYVNLRDYNIGTDKGGEVNMFDDFDIDFNAYKYLMETRCSGALTKPYSAVAIEFVPAAG